MEREVSNPASALGEAIGHIIETRVREVISGVSSKYGYKLAASGDESKKLNMKDKWGNVFDIDMAIQDSKNNPVALIESKYLRYKKHMRDKGSWICVAHSNLRNTYPSIKNCIAILIGDWTKGAKNLLISYEISILEIPFHHIADTLEEYGIDFRWKEKEREKAVEAWKRFSRIVEGKRTEMGRKLVETIESPLLKMISAILTGPSASSLTHIELKLVSNNGARYVFDFKNVQEALIFLSKFDVKKLDEYLQKRDTMDAYLR